jgi:hypothetical protein
VRFGWGATLAVMGCDPIAAPPPGGGPGEAVEIALDVSFQPLSLEPGDFDGDGAIDLLVGGTEGAIVRGAIYRGRGDGTFDPPIDAHLDGASAYAVIGRLSGDDRDDAITLGAPGTLAAFVGQPNATLAPWHAWPEPHLANLRSTAIADFEGDGDGDVFTLRERGVVSGSRFRPEIEIGVTLGAGGDGIWKVQTSTVGNYQWSGFDPVHLATGDFDGDALVDVVLTERDQDLVRLVGTPTAEFGLPFELGVGVPPWSTRVRDMNGDGLDDVVVSSYTTDEVQVLLSAGVAGFDGLASIDASGFAPYDTALGDLDGDGDGDAALVDRSQAALQWHPGDGAGNLGDALTRELASAAIRVHAVDLDDDGRDDVVAATFAAGSISVLMAED